MDNIISIKVPIEMKRLGGKKLMILPEGADATLPKNKPDETLLRGLAKAYFWQKQLDRGQYKSIDDLSVRKKISISYVSRILKLNFLCPQIKESILDGTQPRGLSLQSMQYPFSDIWEEQLVHFGFVKRGKI